ncbi:MAG: hypothetical protein IPJ61_20100 [Tessaracoccus sp.]|uniref:hypothetical protein n=1 Tax=Tessaracoccus sp. TaxID=1971211 RepID=UPI001EB2429C|nr:hypothetical protein [Tessaracoccus sp.]MBK7823290.1 hypothetical protein [Tessaracoccus sp.]
MSDTGKIILAVLGAALVVGIVVVVAKPSTPSPDQNFTPDQNAPPAESNNPTASIVRGVGGALHDVLGYLSENADRTARRERDAADRAERIAAREGTLGLSIPKTPDGSAGTPTQHA